MQEELYRRGSRRRHEKTGEGRRNSPRRPIHGKLAAHQSRFKPGVRRSFPPWRQPDGLQPISLNTEHETPHAPLAAHEKASCPSPPFIACSSISRGRSRPGERAQAGPARPWPLARSMLTAARPTLPVYQKSCFFFKTSYMLLCSGSSPSPGRVVVEESED
jgi:hypothetical protein